MNPDTGVFTAPVSGIYSFSLSALKNPNIREYVSIYVYKNGITDFVIREHDFNSGQNAANIAYSWTMSLVQNDQIKLTIIQGRLYVDSDTFFWFNGNLL